MQIIKNLLIFLLSFSVYSQDCLKYPFGLNPNTVLPKDVVRVFGKPDSIFTDSVYESRLFSYRYLIKGVVFDFFRNSEMTFISCISVKKDSVGCLKIGSNRLDVLDSLGVPNQIDKKGDEEFWVYRHDEFDCARIIIEFKKNILKVVHFDFSI